ncbi:hd domain-containing protein [Moniliophthora roreri]|nr:hd domain-containing protein [Moniliophthora roreri]
MSETAGTSERSFPPLYKSTGDPSVDRLAFFHILERLKTQKRTGWVRNNIPNAESISDHMYRMSVLALCSSDSNLDIAKCVMMCVVHDLAEAQVGDIAPHEGISKAEKHRMEEEAMHSFIHGMLHNTPAAQRIESLYKEYEAGETPEAQFVKDLDKFEMATQALEYERDHGPRTLQPFFDSAALPKLRHPEVKGWGEDLLHERDGLFPLDSTHQSQIE